MSFSALRKCLPNFRTLFKNLERLCTSTSVFVRKTFLSNTKNGTCFMIQLSKHDCIIVLKVLKGAMNNILKRKFILTLKYEIIIGY